MYALVEAERATASSSADSTVPISTVRELSVFAMPIPTFSSTGLL